MTPIDISKKYSQSQPGCLLHKSYWGDLIVDILPGPPQARGFLTLHRDALQVILSSLCVRLKSWRYPIPTWAIFLAAFSSRSWCVAQLRQISFLIERSSLPHLNPHSEHTWLVGSHLSITLKSRPYLSHLASVRVRNSYHPCQLIALARRRFFTIPDTFKSSKITVWFSLTILVDSLCRKSVRLSVILLCCLAIRIRVLFRRLESFCWRANLRCNFLILWSGFE